MPSDNSINPYVSPEITSGTDANAAGPYRDRSIGLTLFGILQLLIAGFWAVMVPFVAFATTMAEPASAQSRPAALPAILLSYGALAAVFGTLGIGSLLARRWARALTLVLAWPWLVMGLAGTIGFVSFMSTIFSMPERQGVPPQAVYAMWFAMGGTIGCAYLFLPAAFVLFYRSLHVKATCERRNPEECWTDRCPLPVLGLSVVISLSGVWLFVTMFSLSIMNSSSISQVLISLSIAVLTTCLAWALYKLRPIAWWSCLALLVVMSVCAMFAVLNTRPTPFPETSGVSPESPDPFQTHQIQFPRMVTTITLALLAGVFGYLLWVRRYFFGNAHLQVAALDGNSPSRSESAIHGSGEEPLMENLKDTSDIEGDQLQ